MGITLTQANEASLLRLNGEIDIAVAAELKARLLDAFAAGKAIRLSVDEIAGLDVAAFELLWAASRQAERAGVEFTVTGQFRKTVRESLSAMDLDVFALSRATPVHREITESQPLNVRPEFQG